MQYTISDLVRMTGMSKSSIRYYENAGLVNPERGDNGYRWYSEYDYQIILFIREFRNIGFTIEDMTRILNGMTMNEMREFFNQKRNENFRSIQEALHSIQKLDHYMHRLWDVQLLGVVEKRQMPEILWMENTQDNAEEQIAFLNLDAETFRCAIHEQGREREELHNGVAVMQKLPSHLPYEFAQKSRSIKGGPAVTKVIKKSSTNWNFVVEAEHLLEELPQKGMKHRGYAIEQKNMFVLDENNEVMSYSRVWIPIEE